MSFQSVKMSIMLISYDFDNFYDGKTGAKSNQRNAKLAWNNTKYNITKCVNKF
ncbi:MAG: hypothetical protein Sylvanvirus11_20 [Sylvanvirus sp.]|uniref:Uncharacterized protein n=1 Tax=Sylvanvirus sp. TaxID=2487774 RepID=A0A3G5AI20_9VIRU|nr:MAG: hypothetical protein Sylvanvirus11_20 [Sylvanvirus sp.]